MDALWRQAKVCHHGDAVFGHQAHGFENPLTPFKLDGAAAGFLHQTSGVAEGLLRGDLIRHERHVRYHQGMLDGANHGLCVVDHVFQRHRNGGVMTLHNVANRVANEQHIHSGSVKDAGRDRIVRRQARNGRAGGLHVDQAPRSNAFSGGRCYGHVKGLFGPTKIAVLGRHGVILSSCFRPWFRLPAST